MNTSRAEAERLLGISEKLLQSRDLSGSRDFAVLAQETEPLLDGSDQIIAVVDVLLAADRRVNNHHDWYAILHADPHSDDPDTLKRHYRRLALLLHPDKNHFPFADQAFNLVSQAWAVLSDPAKKPLFDSELSRFSRVYLAATPSSSAAGAPSPAQQNKLPVRRTQPAAASASGGKLRSFWTVCPYCYVMYEYPRVYEDCCLKCDRCRKAFHAAEVAVPPVVPGQEAYYCCWAFFPMGFVNGNVEEDGGGGEKVAKEPPSPGPPGFPKWMPPMFEGPQAVAGNKAQPSPPPAAVAPITAVLMPVKRKRGRPKLH